MNPSAAPTRTDLVRRGQRLEYFTIVYNSLEGLVSIAAGLVAGSVSLIGFGLHSLIEVTSGAALLWRLHHDLNLSRREQLDINALNPATLALDERNGETDERPQSSQLSRPAASRWKTRGWIMKPAALRPCGMLKALWLRG